MERSFAAEIELLKLGDDQVFRGEGILAVTKALLQSGVSYVGGYQGAPVSHLLDVMVQARDYLDTLGVHVESCTNEASACAMLAASINYPARGTVTWKSIVGTNVAADALSNLASAGVVGGALIVVGEDYGEGASVIQERTHAYAMKSSVWLVDPRPNLTSIVRTVESAFALSEASNTPVIMELRIRACHLQGEFVTSANRAPAVSTRAPLPEPAAFLYDRLSHPPVTFKQEKLKTEVRMPAARRFIVEKGLNESFPGTRRDVGIIVQGGLYNNLMRALELAGLADAFGESQVPILCLNVVYPLVPEEISGFCAGKSAVLVVEEGQPEYIELEVGTILRRADLQTRLAGKDLLQSAGEYSTEAILAGVTRFVDSASAAALAAAQAARADGLRLLGAPVPPRPPTFCVGCPERPFFSAMKLVQEETGRLHVGADIGCHAFGTFEPFSQGNSILGYGMSLASIAGVTPFQERRSVAIMGDGGFWHNGLLSGVSSNLLNGGDGVLVIMKNGYTSATGTQELVSSPEDELKRIAGAGSATGSQMTIEETLQGAGVKWLKSVHNYRVGEVIKTLKEALTTREPGLKVIIAEGECQLERQRRIRPVNAEKIRRGEKVVRVRYGVDENVCTGDHACIRLSGCPSLTIKDPSDPLKVDPVAHVNNNCVGCGLCGEVSHAATLCPSFYRTEITFNPTAWDRVKRRVREWIIGWITPRRAAGAGRAA
ncbi:MAG: indolepyruvate ferredoxin oxidoreductase subunit alpha [Burkholderiales bacterium]|nr:indolepyruvate ferredoxin oxidoreductase subunit alpha [Burkholderiales bacterium]